MNQKNEENNPDHTINDNEDIKKAIEILVHQDIVTEHTDKIDDIKNVLEVLENNQNQSMSDIIRERIENAGSSYHCNDNISEFINKDEYEILVEEITEKMNNLLKSLVIDIKNDHNTQETAKRVAKMYVNETFGGRFFPKPDVTSFPNHMKYDTLYVTGPLDIKSTCAHHFQNIVGKCWVGVAPGANVIGLSKFNRIASWLAHRPTIQEELTVQIADALEKETEASGIAVILKAEHMCMTHRGVRAHESDMTTSVLRGTLKTDPELRKEFYTLLSGMKGWKN